MNRARSVVVAAATLAAACASAPDPILVPPPPPPPSAAASAPVAPPTDPLGARPSVPGAAPFAVPTPEVFDGPSGSKVWLLARPGLPLVSIAAVSRRGGAEGDPDEKPGLASLTAEMLEQGAGKLDAVAFTSALEELGARFSSTATRDASIVSAHFLADRLDRVLGLFCDAIARPQHTQRDFVRTHALFVNDVQSRGDDPSRVAALVTEAALYGVTTPFGRPIEGSVETAKKLTRADVVAAHRAIWSPDQVTFVVVGDVTRDAVTASLAKQLKGWKAETSKTVPTARSLPTPPKVVAVEREDAPQVVMTIARRSLSASSDDRAAFELVALTLGGSFTSRLNQNLREDHGWTYGARARLSVRRHGGAFVARAAIRADVIGDALKETRRELALMAKDGPNDGEIDKAKALLRADVVEAFGSRSHTLSALVELVALALPPDTLGRDLGKQRDATREALKKLSREATTDDATIVLVGPSKAIEAAVRANDLGAVELRDVNGQVVTKK